VNFKKAGVAAFTATAFLLAACAAPPMGPTVAVMPSPSKPMDIFQRDSADCQQYAQGIAQQTVDQTNQQVAGQIIIGALLGAALGGLAGGAGRAVATGAAAGAMVGTAVAADAAPWAQLSIQQQYDIAYSQCMYSRGDQVPGYVQRYTLPPPPPPRS
jgi:uncharacterized protein YcfJ